MSDISHAPQGDDTPDTGTLKVGFFRRHRKATAIGGAVGAFALAGTAVAAVMLSTPISGTASATETQVQASDTLLGGSNTGATDQEDLACSVAVEDGGESLEINATADKKIVVGENGDETVIDDRAGTCRIFVTVKNTGDVPLVVTDFSLDGNVPGWTLTEVSPNNDQLAPGESKFVNAELSASDSAESGSFSGQIVTERAGTVPSP